jgi:hypothetical protein
MIGFSGRRRKVLALALSSTTSITSLRVTSSMLLLVVFQQLNSQLHLPLLTPAAPKLITKPAVLRGLSRMPLLLSRLSQKMRAMLQLAESKKVNQTK